MITTDVGASVIPVRIAGVVRRKPEEKWLDYVKRVMGRVEKS